MKNYKTHSRKSLLHPSLRRVVIGVLAVSALVALGLELTNTTNFIGSSDNSPVATQSSGPSAEQKQQEAESKTESKKQALEEKASSPTAQQPQSKNVELSAQQESNETITVFTKLMGYSSGTCELTATNVGKSSTQLASITYQREFSSCAGFSVPISSLGKGLWTLKLTVTSAEVSESKTISHEVK